MYCTVDKSHCSEGTSTQPKNMKDGKCRFFLVGPLFIHEKNSARTTGEKWKNSLEFSSQTSLVQHWYRCVFKSPSL